MTPQSEMKPCPSGHMAVLVHRPNGMWDIGCENLECFFNTCLDKKCDGCTDGWVNKKDAINKWNIRLDYTRSSGGQGLVAISREHIAFMVQEIISEAHSRPVGASMHDLIDKYDAKFCKTAYNAGSGAVSVERIEKMIMEMMPKAFNYVMPLEDAQEYIEFPIKLAQAIHAELCGKELK